MSKGTFWREVAVGLVLAQSCLLTRLSATPFPQSVTANQKAAEQDPFLSGSRLSLERILGAVDVPPERLSTAIRNRGLTFEATPQNIESLKRAGLSEKVIDAVRKAAPYKPPPPPPPPPLVGSIALKCSPAECNVNIDGKPKGSTTGGALAIRELPPGDIVVDFERDGYIGQQKTIAIEAGKDVSAEAALEPSEATKGQFGTDLLSMAVQALGGDAGLKDVGSLSASGAVVLWNKEGQRSDWTLNALVKLPDMALFDLEGSVANFWLALVGDKYKSGGDRKKLGGLLGAGSSDKNRSLQAGEFDSSLRIFRDYQLSALVARMRTKAFRLSAPSLDADDKGELHLKAAGNAEAYELTLGSDKLPARATYESELGLGSGTEIVYSNYKDAGKGKYPLTMAIKLPDAPHHGMEVQFENAMPAPDLKEKDFSQHVKPRK
jgi:hypothetical protein